jgi:hypothetical protein
VVDIARIVSSFLLVRMGICGHIRLLRILIELLGAELVYEFVSAVVVYHLLLLWLLGHANLVAIVWHRISLAYFHFAVGCFADGLAQSLHCIRHEDH